MSARRLVWTVLSLAALVCFAIPTASAMAEASEPLRPLVFVPGVMGSKLCERVGESDVAPFGDPVWGDRYSYTVRRVRKLTLGPDAIADATALEPCGIVSSVNIIPILYTESIYLYAEEFFEDELGYREDENLFYFAYDWRLGSKTTAAQLKDFINAVRARTGAEKVDVVAHSMGGLVAARYVMDHDGDDALAKLVTLGTPFWGSALTFERLWSGVSGYPDETLGVVEEIRKAILSFPSTFDLLPSYENCCWFEGREDPFDPFDPNVMTTMSWLVEAMPGPPEEAEALLAQRLRDGRETSMTARAFLDRFRGDSQEMLFLYAAASNFETVSRVFFSSANGSVTRSIDRQGDGVVVLASAAASLRPDPSQFADEKHDVLFRSRAARNWLDNLLLEDRVVTSRTRTPMATLQSGDAIEIKAIKSRLSRNLLFAGDAAQVEFEIVAENPIGDGGFGVETIAVFAEGAENGATLTVEAGPGTSRLVRHLVAPVVAPATPGAYRVTLEISGNGAPVRVDEWFMVVEQ